VSLTNESDLPSPRGVVIAIDEVVPDFILPEFGSGVEVESWRDIEAHGSFQ
jgi:hypothetical protein